MNEWIGLSVSSPTVHESTLWHQTNTMKRQKSVCA